MEINHESNLVTFLSGLVAGVRYGTSKTWGWGDITGVYIAPATGGTAPTTESFDGELDLGFDDSDTISWKLPRPHWAVVGGNKYITVHVGIAAATVASGSNLNINLSIRHRTHNLLGSGEALRTAIISNIGINATLTAAQLNSTAGNTWVVESLYAQTGGGAGLLNSSIMLPDDDIIVTCTVTSFPTLTGGTSQKIRFPFCDEHTEVTWGGTFRRFFTSLSFN
jgi:hypothetical protein